MLYSYILYKPIFLEGYLDDKDTFSFAYSVNNNYDISLHILLKINNKFYSFDGHIKKDINNKYIQLQLKTIINKRQEYNNIYSALDTNVKEAIVKDILQIIKNGVGFL